MNYGDILSWLQGLLGNQQGTNASQFQQGLGFQGQQLAQQGQEFNASLDTQKAMQAAELANRLALQQGGTAGQLAVQAPQLDTQKAMQAAELANRIALQGGQLGEQGREFNTTAANNMQQQLWNQMFAQQNFVSPQERFNQQYALAKLANPQPPKNSSVLVTPRGTFGGEWDNPAAMTDYARALASGISW